MSTTVKHVGSEREWEGSLGRWEKHQDCITHWCDGGEVEVSVITSSGRWEVITER